ncbi:hypothetical protein [Arthrobacter sp. ISL-65]|uniref:hypothetical protein n=1 Tax=Arthrobacter sp. ISL-65 TaxID=2819112 RepID=UPI001BE8B9C6|nr:hypothetical protein [Arthrobacter sp. ISL-65]MBT2547563.1 hypothetical protein [Arthrobacter sp. ISL-65]
MTSARIRRPLMAAAVLLAVLSLAAVGAVIALAAAGQAAPQWITSTALYGLPASFLLMLVLVVDGVAARRRAGNPAER